MEEKKRWYEDEDGDTDKLKVTIVVISGVLGILLFLGVLFGFFFVVGPGEQGVIFNTFSGVKEKTYDEGFHFKMPFFEKPYRFEVRTQVYDADASAASKDLQVVSTKVALNFHVEKAYLNTLFKEIGGEYRDRIIRPSVQEVVKAVTSKHIAEELITKRELVKDEIKNALRERLAVSHLILDDLSITNFDFSQEFNHAIEQKVTAEQNALKELNNLKLVEYQAQQSVAKARGEAEAIKLTNEELQKSPQYVSYLMIQKWDGKMPLSVGGGSLLAIHGALQ